MCCTPHRQPDSSGTQQQLGMVKRLCAKGSRRSTRKKSKQHQCNYSVHSTIQIRLTPLLRHQVICLSRKYMILTWQSRKPRLFSMYYLSLEDTKKAKVILFVDSLHSKCMDLLFFCELEKTDR